MRTSEKTIQSHKKQKPQWGLFCIEIFGMISIIIAVSLIAGGIYLAKQTQNLPPLEIFEHFYAAMPASSVIVARDGKTVITTLDTRALSPKYLEIHTQTAPSFSAPLLRIFRGTRTKSEIAQALIEQILPDWKEKKLSTKLLSVLLTRQLLAKYGQDQIFSWFLNNAYFGQSAFGADAAALTYLNKSATDVTLPEAVLLSAIQRAPALNPIDSQGAVRDTYLEETKILSDAIPLTENEKMEILSSHFVIFEPPATTAAIQPNPILSRAKTEAAALIGQAKWERGGYQIQTTMDYHLQKLLECLTNVTESIRENECPLYPKEPFSEDERAKINKGLHSAAISVAILDSKTGETIAGIDMPERINGDEKPRQYFSSGEPGSLLTPFIALYAFQQGISPSTMVWDVPEQNYSLPADYHNADEESNGPIRLRTALVHDDLSPIDSLLKSLNSSAVWQQAAQLGITGLTTPKPDQLLFEGGSLDVETVARALLPFAAKGKMPITPQTKTIIAISQRTANEKQIWHRRPIESNAVLDEGLAYLITHIFSEEELSYRYLDRPAAFKVGRVHGKTIRWAAGYTPNTVVTIRIESTSLTPEAAENAAIHLWQTIINETEREKPAQGWNRPEQVRQIMVCNPSGKLPGRHCPETISEVFIAGNEPHEIDDFYLNIALDRRTMKLATAQTPYTEMIYQVVRNIPPEFAHWAIEHQIQIKPQEFMPVQANANESISIVEPTPFQKITLTSLRETPLLIKADFDESQEQYEIQIAIGKGLNPVKWIEINRVEKLTPGRWSIAQIDETSLIPGVWTLRIQTIHPNQPIVQATQFFIVESTNP